jgi:hypothetical protein
MPEIGSSHFSESRDIKFANFEFVELQIWNFEV